MNYRQRASATLLLCVFAVANSADVRLRAPAASAAAPPKTKEVTATPKIEAMAKKASSVTPAQEAEAATPNDHKAMFNKMFIDGHMKHAALHAVDHGTKKANLQITAEQMDKVKAIKENLFGPQKEPYLPATKNNPANSGESGPKAPPPAPEAGPSGASNGGSSGSSGASGESGMSKEGQREGASGSSGAASPEVAGAPVQKAQGQGETAQGQGEAAAGL